MCGPAKNLLPPERGVEHRPQSNETGPGLCGADVEHGQDAHRTYGHSN